MELLNTDAFETAAASTLPRPVYDYYAGGAEDELTLRANRAAFDRYVLVPRVLVDVSRVDASVELLRARFHTPVLIAPTAMQRLAHPDGEIAVARAAAGLRTLYIASTLATTPIEQITAASDATVWLQLYLFRDRELTRELVQRAESAGCTAICLTTTVPVQGKRERDHRNRLELPPGLELANFRGLEQARFPESAGSGLDAFIARQFDASLTWDAVEWLMQVTRLPVVLKGINHPADARMAVERGVSVLIVSNHGGRQLDGAVASLDALPGVVEAAQGRVPVLVDGGIRRGTHVLKAVALGATAVLVGRPVLWGLAAGGQAGVEQVLTLLHSELLRAMALCGSPRLAAITRDVIRAA